jgi:hypothetical protein
MVRLVAGLVVAVAVLALAAPMSARAEWQRGVNFTTYSADTYGTPASDSSLARLAADGNSSVAILVKRFMAGNTASSIAPAAATPTDASLLHAMHTAHSLGLEVVLKPQIGLLPGGWAGTIAPADPAAWFDSYQATIYHYADLAQQGGAAMLIVGTELQTMSGSAYTARWQQIIAGVRQRFSGRLTYAANYDEFPQVGFWPSLDYVGVDAYWRLSNAPDPPLEDLVAAWTWRGYLGLLRQTSLAAGRPVLLTEVGYRSVAGATIHPNWWENSGALDVREQANAYEAAYRAFAGQPWFAGLYWWSWPATLPADGANSDYTPTFKPAEQVMRSWNAKLAPGPGVQAPAPPGTGASPPAAPRPPTTKRPTKRARSCRRSRRAVEGRKPRRCSRHRRLAKRQRARRRQN